MSSETELDRDEAASATSPAPNRRILLQSAVAAGVCLGIPPALQFWTVLLLGSIPYSIASTINALPSIVSAGGAVIWGWALATITHYRPKWRLVLGSTFGLFLGRWLAFSVIHTYLFNPMHRQQPPHVAFGVFFTLAVMSVSASMGSALGITVGNWRILLRLTIGNLTTSGLTVVLIILLLDLVGLRVGTGSLAMPKVTAFGTLLAAMVNGIMMGSVFSSYARRSTMNIAS